MEEEEDNNYIDIASLFAILIVMSILFIFGTIALIIIY